MAYLHIDNLYKNQDILLFKECYALEKVHGSSAHIHWGGACISYFPGGEDATRFEALFDDDALCGEFAMISESPVTVYGEVYGGKCQGMSETYGKELHFIAFDVKIGEVWLNVPAAEEVVVGLGLEFVPYDRVPATVEALNEFRDESSVVGFRRTTQKLPREGIVIRPLIELHKNNGKRIIAKHKSEEFAERRNVPKVSKEAPEVLAAAQAISDEWVTPMRLTHVLDKIEQPHDLTKTGEVIKAMVADVLREGEGEIVNSKVARKAMSRTAATLYKKRLQAQLNEREMK